jgi:hypothetical protein
MGRQRLTPLGAGEVWCRASPAAVEKNFALVISPNEMAPTFKIRDPAPSMRMQGHDISCCNASVNDAHPLIFQQQSMVNWRGNERIQRVRPRPAFRVGKIRVLAHAVLGDLIYRIFLSHVPSRNTNESPGRNRPLFCVLGLLKLIHRGSKRTRRHRIERQFAQVCGKNFDPPRPRVARILHALHEAAHIKLTLAAEPPGD